MRQLYGLRTNISWMAVSVLTTSIFDRTFKIPSKSIRDNGWAMAMECCVLTRKISRNSAVSPNFRTGVRKIPFCIRQLEDQNSWFSVVRTMDYSICIILTIAKKRGKLNGALQRQQKRKNSSGQVPWKIQPLRWHPKDEITKQSTR